MRPLLAVLGKMSQWFFVQQGCNVFLFLSHHCFHCYFIQGLGKGDQLLACQNLYSDTTKQSELRIFLIKKKRQHTGARLLCFIAGQVTLGTGIWVLYYHSAMAGEDKLDLEECTTTFKAVVAYQNSMDISFSFDII